MFHLRLSVPISIICELTGIKEERLLNDYRALVLDDHTRSIPLAALPLDVRDKYIHNYLLHDVLIDLDIFALAGYKPGMRKKHFPITTTDEFKVLSYKLNLIREATAISIAYAGTQESTTLLKDFAKAHGISYRTLNRWRFEFMKNEMINRLLDPDHAQYQYSDSRRTICLYAVDYTVYRHIYGMKVSDNKILREFGKMGDFPCSKCPYSDTFDGDRTGIPFTCKRNRTTMLKPKNRYTLNRITNEISEQDVIMCREGVRAWENKYHFTPLRKRPEKFGFLYITDHHLADLFVITRIYPDGTFDAKRVYITGVMDGATNAPVGYALRTDPPNASTVAEAFANAVGFTVDSPFHGLCRVWYSDNGKDYRSSLIKGNDSWSRSEWISPEESTEFYNPNVEFTESGILNWFGIRQIYALPYRACSKKIERHWRTLEEEYFSDLPGYCGNDPKHRPAKFFKDMKNGNLYTFEQFANHFAETIWPDWCNFKSEPNSKSPMDLYNELPHEPTMTPSWRSLTVLKYKTEERIVQQSGIRFNNMWYWHPALASYISEKVHIFAFDTPFNRSIAVTSKHMFLCEAHPIHHLDTVEDQRWRVVQHLREQAHQKLEITSRLRSIEEIILKSNILSLGLKVPAVIKLTYAPAIDNQKDKTEAEDDKRIPEQLKALAEKYADNIFSFGSATDDNPLGDYFETLGNKLQEKNTND